MVSGRSADRGGAVVGEIRAAAGRADFVPADLERDPRAIALAARYPASDEASFVHGTVIDADGGRVGVAVIAG